MNPETAQLEVFGSLGKATTRTMLAAILGDSDAGHAAVVVLSPPADAEAEWRDSIATLPEGGVAVLSADHPGITAPAATRAQVVTFGLTESADYRAADVDARIDGTSFTLHHAGEQHRVVLHLLGEHQAVNACAALAAVHRTGASLDAAIASLGQLRSLEAATVQRYELGDGTIVINDAVSATPASTAAALKTLALVSGQHRSVAVLGEQTTGDEDSREAHDRLGRLVVRLNIKKLVVVGQDARHIHNAAGLEGSWDGESVLVDTPDEAYDLLREELHAGDIVLVKSSKQAGLDALARRLAEVAR